MKGGRAPISRLVATSATDILIVAFNSLTPDEQERAYAQITDARVTRLAGEESEMARHLRSLRRVADVVGGELTPEGYTRTRRQLVAEGEEIIEINALRRFFGSWSRAKEALGLTDVATPLRIEARFRAKRVGKVHRYRDETLREIVHRCAADLGHPPLVIEFELWRQREHELAQARGEELHLPSDSPYRRRWGTWEAALLALGFDEADVLGRLEPGRATGNANLSPFQYASGRALVKRGPGV
jgi:Homing endonuclease associated repeat